MERRLLEKADILFCSSPELAAIKKRAGLRTEILPHGVDYDHFSRCISNKHGNIAPLAGHSRPVIGYFGLLGEWVDAAILENIAQSHPDWSLLLMGKVEADTRRLALLPNVRFTGPVPYGELPDYVAHVDVLVLPYHIEGRGQTITPLKLREYIATGKPVVSTAVPECVQYSPQIAIAGPEEFVNAVERALCEPPGTGIIRQQIVAGESWAIRAEFLSRCIGEALEEKSGNRRVA
jgi:glycosyltransferase involved in cell wall biosynthesis